MLGILVIFALIGLVSAGIFVGNHVSASGAKKKATVGTTNTVALQDVNRAQQQATAIVKAAQDAGNSIVKNSTRKAHQQAAAIVAAAHKHARQIAAAQPTAVPAVPTAPAVAAIPATISPAPAPTSVSVTSGSLPPAAVSSTPAVVAGSAPTAAPPNLSGVPAAWQVVGYNASFGSGPGSAGSISVLNRSGRTYRGTVVVRYTRGGSASAPFVGLGPGQAVSLPLNGPAYGGGGYTISLVGLHWG